MIYLDNHLATVPCSSSLERMQPYLTDQWGTCRMSELEARYRAIYDLVGAGIGDTCIFTSSGAEAVNQALWSAFFHRSKKEGKCHFIASSLEDAPTMQMLHRLEEFGCFAKIAPVKRTGEIDVEKLASLINPRTALVSITMADALTGVLQPIAEIAALCKEKGVLLHVDASYAVGKLYLNFSDLDVDYLSFSGDKMHALKSSGALFVKARSPISPLIVGGPDQAGLRGGALDVPSFMALSAAAYQSQLFADRLALETVRLRDLFESELMQKIPGAKSLFIDSLRLPNVSVMSFPKVHAEALLYLLHKKGLFASLGGHFSQPLSQILGAIGIEPSIAETAMSFSLSRYTTEAEILRAIALIEETASHLQSISKDLF